jgi:hypothetical protein
MAEDVRFNATGASIMGAICGVALATGVPWVLLSFGTALDHTVMTVLVIFGVVVGGLMALASAFFGVVMPTQVGGPDAWHGHHRHHHHHRTGRDEAVEPAAGAPKAGE